MRYKIIVILLIAAASFTGCSNAPEMAKGQQSFISNQTQSSKPPQPNQKHQALALAAMKGDTAAVRSMLARGRHVNQADEYGSTILMSTASAGQANTVRALLDMGADVNAKQNYSQLTPLMFAAKNSDDAETIRALLEHGADTEAKSRDGNTALIIAAQEGHVKALKALIAGGADIKA